MENTNKKINKNNINDIIDIVYLTPENAEFTLSDNKFLQLKANVRNPEKNKINIMGKDAKTEEEDEIEIEEFFFERVFLHRAFPFDNPLEYISVSGSFPKLPEPEPETKPEEKKPEGDAPEPEKKPDLKENTTSFGDLKEIGIITNIKVFDETQQKYLIDELNRKYFIPLIESISSVKEKYGFSYWETNTNIGKIKFTVHDAFRNILKINEDRIMVTDVNGNRYEIISLNKLDRQSFRKIELFL